MPREGRAALTELTDAARRRAAGTLLAARVAYGFNWYNIGGVLPLIGTGLNATTVQLGIVVGVFLVGAGVFQLPAGLAALRWGSRTVSLGGLAVMAVATLASAFSPDWVTLALLRFAAGAAAAFFFAPALGLVASYFPVGSKGPIVGMYNAGFSLGAGVGLFGGTLLGKALGWQAPLALGGFLLAATTIVSFALLPRQTGTENPADWKGLWKLGRPVMRSPSLWALAIALTGFWGAAYIEGQYFVNFASAIHPDWGLEVAAGATALFILLQVVGGPIGGWLGERSRDMRRILVIGGVTVGALVCAIPFLPLWGVWPAMALLGFTAGIIFAVLYLLPTYFRVVRGEGVALSLALLNSVQIFVGSGLAIGFALVAETSGYTLAWLFAGVVAVATLPLLFWVEPGRERGRALIADCPASSASEPTVTGP